jgi:hypothetical protein
LRVNAVIVWKRTTQGHDSRKYVTIRCRSRTWGLSENKWRYGFHRVFIIFGFEHKRDIGNFEKRESVLLREDGWFWLQSEIIFYVFSSELRWIEHGETETSVEVKTISDENCSLHWLDLTVIWIIQLVRCWIVGFLEVFVWLELGRNDWQCQSGFPEMKDVVSKAEWKSNWSKVVWELKGWLIKFCLCWEALTLDSPTV